MKIKILGMFNKLVDFSVEMEINPRTTLREVSIIRKFLYKVIIRNMNKTDKKMYGEAIKIFKENISNIRIKKRKNSSKKIKELTKKLDEIKLGMFDKSKTEDEVDEFERNILKLPNLKPKTKAFILIFAEWLNYNKIVPEEFLDRDLIKIFEIYLKVIKNKKLTKQQKERYKYIKKVSVLFQKNGGI